MIGQRSKTPTSSATSHDMPASLQLPVLGVNSGKPSRGRNPPAWIDDVFPSWKTHPSMTEKKTTSGWRFVFFKTLVTSPIYMDKQVHMSSPGFFEFFGFVDLWGTSFPTSTWLGPESCCWSSSSGESLVHCSERNMNWQLIIAAVDWLQKRWWRWIDKGPR